MLLFPIDCAHLIAISITTTTHTISSATTTTTILLLLQLTYYQEHDLTWYSFISSLFSLLLFLYCRQLKSLSSPSGLAKSQADTDLAPKAIAGLNFAVRIITDTTTDLNDQLALQPHLLTPCSPITPYSAYHCLMVLSHFEQFIPDADVRFHAIYSSLHFLAKRWAIAGESSFNNSCHHISCHIPPPPNAIPHMSFE